MNRLGQSDFADLESFEAGFSDDRTLRDWFAGQVIAGYIASGAGMTDWKIFAQLAYKAADAMILERSK